MESLAKSDIFFVVTTAVVLFIGILISILLISAIRTAYIIKKALKSSSEYIEEIKNDFKKHGAIATLIKRFFSKNK